MGLVVVDPQIPPLNMESKVMMFPFNPTPYIVALFLALWFGYKVGQASMIEIEEEDVDPFIEDQRMAAEAGLQ